MKTFFQPPIRSRGSALLIVLAFLLLLTTLVVAFLSRATLERQLSSASFSQGKTDLAAQGAISAIIDDLQQEIQAGSNVGAGTTIPAVASGYYYPNSPTTSVPALVVPGYTSSSIVGTGMENLLKISKSGSPFYPATGYSSTGSSRASNVNSSSNPSLNNRSVSLLRWNAPLLLARDNPSSTTDYTPVTTFTAPDWIYVARDASNPTSWDTSYIYNPSISPSTTSTSGSSGTNAVTQRYAYAIYDEGGTLDLNVAGNPSYNSTTWKYSPLQPYKNALIYADLTQLPYLSTLSTANQIKVINAIVGWRNNSSATPTLPTNDSFPNYTTFQTTIPTTTKTTLSIPSIFTGYPLDYYVINSKGFRDVGGLVPTMGNNSNPGNNFQNQTDNAFASRQQLIQFFTQGLAQNSTFSASATVAALENALQYFGTFSRGLSQPSYAANPNRPTIMGTSTSTAYQVGGNDGQGGDSSINPPFLSVTVPASGGGWARNDGSTAVAGEPLVKKRFALNRLAWITYEGPSADRTPIKNNTAPAQAGGDGDLYRLENEFGISQSWLAQGTDANVPNEVQTNNIQNYIGLIWNATTGAWIYAPIGYSATSPYTGPILTLSQVAALKSREPNFFELLKAAVTAGAVGKDWNNPTDIPAATEINNIGGNYSMSSVDRSIFQIGVNIIDQSTADGFPTMVGFTLNSTAGIQYVYGVKNLPYLYGLRATTFTTVLPGSPVTSASITYTGTPSPLGTWVYLQEPEIWNPHAWNPTSQSTINDSVGYPAPSAFQLSASTPPSSNPVTMYQAGLPTLPFPPYHVSSTLAFGNVGSNSSYYTTNTGVTATGASIFREPTLLLVPNIPADSGLEDAGGGAINAYGIPSVWNGFGPTGYTGSGSTQRQYLGFQLCTGSECIQTSSSAGQTLTQLSSSTTPTVTYVMSCTGPYGQINYDNKLCVVPGGTGGGRQSNSQLDFTSTAAKTYQAEMIPRSLVYHVMDPRTARFGFLCADGTEITSYTYTDTPVTEPPMAPGTPSSPNPGHGWLGGTSATGGSTQNILETMRPDNHAGYGTVNWHTYQLPLQQLNEGWVWANDLPTSSTGAGEQYAIRLGLFAQNSTTDLDDPLPFQGFVNSYNALTYNTLTPQYYADADGVVRRGMAGYLPTSSSLPSTTAIGQPLATANTLSSGTLTPVTAGGTNVGTIYSRPIILNRPFRSVGELGYVFSDTPWKNLDLQTPESGYAALMDTFCINDTNDPKGLVAGVVDLNTKQAPVLQAVINGTAVDRDGTLTASVDTTSPTLIANPTTGTTPATTLNSTVSAAVAAKLVARTTSTASGMGPLVNVSDLVGKYVSRVSASYGGIDGSQSYSGFSGDMTSILSADPYLNNIERFREAPIRALTAVGNTRVWNLMIDVIAQTGRFPSSATGLVNFNVEGERRYWVHIAIDRYTGKVLDEQLEEVKE